MTQTVFFFFSSRRRHTILQGDWSSDVCSSDLATEWQPEVLQLEAVDAVLELEHFGLPFSRTPDGRIDQRRFGGHTRNHGEGPVRRACYAADRTGHLILQTLYQQCVARGVTFFNEFQVFDVSLVDGRVAAVVAYE